MKTAMIAFGGNALSPRGETGMKGTIGYMIQQSSQNILPRENIEAGIYFLRHPVKKVVITSIPNIKNGINGKSGTIIRKKNENS